MLGSRGGGAQAREVRRAVGVLGAGDRLDAVAVERLPDAGRGDREDVRGLGGDEEGVRDAAREQRNPAVLDRVLFAIGMDEDLAFEDVDRLLEGGVVVQRRRLAAQHVVFPERDRAVGLG